MSRLPNGTGVKIARQLGITKDAVYWAIEHGTSNHEQLAAILTELGLKMRNADLALRSIKSYRHNPRSTNENVSRQRLDQRLHWEHNAARAALHRHIKKGLISLATNYRCVDCGEQAQEYDHYLGYAARYALSIHPVCRPCHNQRRRKVRQTSLKLP